MKTKRLFETIKIICLALLCLFPVLFLSGCQPGSGDSGDSPATGKNEFSTGDSVVLTTADGGTIAGTVIDLDSNGDPDGIDLDGNADTLEFVFIENSSPVSTFTTIASVDDGSTNNTSYAVDGNGDGAIDFYLQILDFDTGKAVLNTRSDGSGTAVKIVVGNSGDIVGIDTTGDGSSNITVVSSMVLNDTTPPVVGNSGTLTVTGVLSASLSLSWSPATDDGTPAGFLQYKVVQSVNDNVDDLANAETDGGGRSVIQDWTTAIGSKIVSGLSPYTRYYFAVLVQDARGNKSIYTPIMQETNRLALTGSWISAEGDSTLGLNFDVSMDADNPGLIELNSKLYATWNESNGHQVKIRVREWNGTQWRFIDGNATDGISYDSNAFTPDPTVHNSKLYTIWKEWYSNSRFHIRFKEWDGSTWRSLDGHPNNGLNFDPGTHAQSPRITSVNSKLYAAWYEIGTNGNIRVSEWDGTNWSFIDGNTNVGLNYRGNLQALSPDLTVHDNKLYVAWEEKNSASVQQIRVREWDNTNWTFVDGSSDVGLNFDSGENGRSTNLTSFGSKLYAAWAENAGGKNQIRVKEWDNTNWSFVDGSSDVGLNHDTSHTADYPYLSSFNSRLYLTWSEYDGLNYIVRVREWDGTQWKFVDGNTDTGLNYDPTRSNDGSRPKLREYQSSLYSIWAEGNSGNKKIRIKKAEME